MLGITPIWRSDEPITETPVAKRSKKTKCRADKIFNEGYREGWRAAENALIYGLSDCAEEC